MEISFEIYGISLGIGGPQVILQLPVELQEELREAALPEAVRMASCGSHTTMVMPSQHCYS